MIEDRIGTLATEDSHSVWLQITDNVSERGECIGGNRGCDQQEADD